ncbi:MAG: peptidyl-prolyl cis-trans isomerase [Crocinitomicaceae bacterium]
MPRYSLFIVFLLLILSACSGKDGKGRLLAQVYDEKLYEEELTDHLKQIDYTSEDSAMIADEFIQEWLDDHILIHHAQKHKEIDEEEIERKVDRFRKDLYILKLEQQLVNEQLDTIISDQEIKSYYEKHKQDFQLNDYLVKVLYIKIPDDAPDIEQIVSTYKLNKETDVEALEIYAKIYATNYYYDKDSWIYFDDLLKEIPLQDINKDRFIMKRSKIRFQEQGYHYFLNILDYKLKNTLSPLGFERKNIRERILNIRVKELRDKVKQDIISKAYDDKAVKIY